MKSNWAKVKLIDVCVQITDGAHNTVYDTPGGDCFLLSCKNIKNGAVRIGEKERRIDKKTLENLRSRTKMSIGDVLISSVGTIGETAIVKEDNPPYEFQRSVAIFKPNQRYITPKFLYYSLRHKKKKLQHLAEGAVQQCLFINPLKEFEISIPTLEEQEKIVNVLSSLDNKIELNEKINQNLEAQAQAIFKSWFVDFEPFGGKMPADWKAYKLGEFLPVITGKKNANVSSSKGKYPFFSCAQDMAWTDEFSFDANAILVAGNGDFNVKFYSGKFEAYQRTYVLVPYDPNFTNWLYYVVKYNLEKITSGARGSVIKFITKGNLEDFSFFAPRNLDKFTPIDFFNSANNKIAENKLEILKLSQLRDTLLPKLMSKEIDVLVVAV